MKGIFILLLGFLLPVFSEGTTTDVYIGNLPNRIYILKADVNSKIIYDKVVKN